MDTEKPEQLPIPDPNLPPAELQKAWSAYLDQTVGRPGAIPRKEVVLDPTRLELVAGYLDMPMDYMKMPLSPKMEKFMAALQKALEQLPPVQREVVERVYGIHQAGEQTQQEIAEEIVTINGVGVSRTMVQKYLRKAKKSLKRIIEREMGIKDARN